MIDAAPASWDSLIRGVSLGAGLIITFLFWWPKPHRLTVLCGTALTAATIAFNLLGFAPAAPARPLLAVAATTAPFWFWAVIQLLFEDRTRFAVPVWLALVALTALAIATQFCDPAWRPVPASTARVLGVGLVVHAAYTVLKGRRTDLVTGRLHLRNRLFAVLCITIAVFVTATVLAPLIGTIKPNNTAAMAAVALFQLGACYLLLSPRLALVPPPAAAVPAIPLSPPPSPEAARLIACMERDKPWHDPALTIAGLATLLALPEYRLRRLINETLGHRNFAAFLNSYRLAAAADALRADPKRPILTVALEHGFGSIGPFNRAFREQYGTTPTDWRRTGG